jgi:ABC-type enterobactin transport system permease subunit
MKALIFIGVILLATGILGLFVQNISYVEKKTIAQIGGAKIEAKVPRAVQVPREAAYAAIGNGAALAITGGILAGRKRR